MDITYTSKQIYKFDRQLSYPRRENDKIVVLNVAMNVFLQIKDEEIKRIVKTIGTGLNARVDRTPIVGDLKRLIEIMSGKRKAVLQISEDIANSQLGLINNYIFRIFPNQSSLYIQTTPKQYFFDGVSFCLKGDEIQGLVCKIVEDVIKRRQIRAIRRVNDGSFKFAFFYYKNNTHDGQYKILSGFNDSTLTSRILTWEGKPHLALWTNETKSISTCNLFKKATDGVLFPPHLKPEGSVNVYVTDICRAVQLYYRKTITYQKIIGYRFETGDDFLKKIGSKYSTKCFCITRLEQVPKYDDGCLYKGALDLSLCHAQKLSGNGFLETEIRTTICYGSLSEYNNQFLVTMRNETYYGLFAIHEPWCASTGLDSSESVCNVYCNYMLDDHLRNDINCLRKIFDANGRWSAEFKDFYESNSLIDLKKCEQTILDDCSLSYETNQIVPPSQQIEC
ncbi:hypothetical protein HA402_011750 [Bradysia odoriphaga]|nr:hypothetical protein HA402_011750 [Bradysia odoriphaga]